jgi:uroporphyrinogen decarboxylase
LEVKIARHFDHDAIFAWHPFTGEVSLEVIARERSLIGKEKAIVGLIGSAFWGMEQIHDHMEFAARLADDMDGLHEDARRMQAEAIKRVHALAEAGADVAYIPNDQAFNTGPYFSPAVYEELVLPYAKKVYAEIRQAGLIGIYHTDGKIMSIIDRIVETGAHGLQSIDPMAGMDIREVKKRTYGKLALLGNVQCNLLQEGPEEAIRASARYCLEHGSPGSGYVFMASNSIFPGMPLKNYLIMQDEYQQFISNQ